MVVDVGYDDELVGVRLGDQLRDAVTHRLRRTHEGTREHAHCLRLLRRGPKGFDVVDRRLAQPTRATKNAGERHLLGRRPTPRLGGGRGGDDVDTHHRIGPAELLLRLEAGTIDLNSRGKQLWPNMAGKTLWQA